MKIEFLLFLILSAFLHAFFNLLMRRAGGSRLFLFGMIASAAVFSILLTFFTGEFHEIPWQYAPYVFGAGLFYVLYQVMVSKAYESGEISRYYPLTVLSPVFIPIWAYLFLSERISLAAGAGIAITLIGAMIVKLDRLSLAEFRKMFRFSKEYRSARFALAASFFFSIAAVMDKSKLSHFDLNPYHAILLTSMTLNLLIYFVLLEKQPLSQLAREKWFPMLTGGVTILLSFIFFRVALKEVDVSLAVPVRLSSVIFAIMLGVFFLKERFRLSNLTGSLVIIAGVVLVSLGI